jgi:cytochrome oxidase Cu insertion factor (SCO1/SenC/PrrC family)
MMAMDREVHMFKLLSVCAAAGVGAAVMAAMSAGGQSASGQPPAASLLKAGDSAPAFELQGSDGKVHRLSDHKGKTVVLAWFPKAFTGG